MNIHDRIRVGVLTYSFYENDNRVKRYAETLAKRGDHVDVVALRKEGAPYYEVIHDVHVYRIQKRVINERRKMTYLIKLLSFFFRSALLITRKNMESNYHAIHVHSVPDFEVFAALIPKLCGAKVILDIHDIVPEFYASKFNRKHDDIMFKALTIIERLSIAFSDHTIISNHLWYDTICSRSASKKKCTVIMNYPDESVFYKRLNEKQDGKFIIIYPGTFSWHQGLDIAIRSFALIKDKAPHADFHIYGRGSEQKTLERLIERLGLVGRAFMHPILPVDEIAKIMADADLGVVPKRDDPFGGSAFSTKILEFMTLGIPVVVADTKIDRYYFNDSVVSFFKAGDEEDLARAFLNLIESPDLRSRLIQNSSLFVQNYTWSKNRDTYLNIVDSY